MIKKFKKKPVIIEAIQWTGKNLSEIDNFMGGLVENKGTTLVIYTLEGDMEASIGDYIIKGVNGEFYPCKPDIFAKTYEEVTNYSEKDIISNLEIKYQDNKIFFFGFKPSCYAAEGMQLIRNLLEKGLYEIDKVLSTN